jgi:hypothetical protein
MGKAMWAAVGALAILPAAAMAVRTAGHGATGRQAAGGKFDRNWATHRACEAHGETPAYKWEFPSTIKDNFFHGQHGEQGGPGYLLSEEKIADDGSAKLSARGHVTQNHAHVIFAMKGNNYRYDVKAQFEDNEGHGHAQ